MASTWIKWSVRRQDMSGQDHVVLIFHLAPSVLWCHLVSLACNHLQLLSLLITITTQPWLRAGSVVLHWPPIFVMPLVLKHDMLNSSKTVQTTLTCRNFCHAISVNLRFFYVDSSVGKFVAVRCLWFLRKTWKDVLPGPQLQPPKYTDLLVLTVLSNAIQSRALYPNWFFAQWILHERVPGGAWQHDSMT